MEEILLLHETVAEVAVISVPYTEWGESLFACVVSAPGQQTDARVLEDWCREHIASFKCPRRYRFLAALPKNNYGKVLKTVLREHFSQHFASEQQ